MDLLGTFANTPAEVHALAHGLFWGLFTRPWRVHPGEMIPDNEDAQAESHYFRGAFIVGAVLQLLAWAILVAVAPRTVL